MRYLGIDAGEKTIGVAVGELLAHELTTLRSGKKKTFYDTPIVAYRGIEQLFKREACDAIVVGLPVKENGEITSEAKKIKKFADGLEQFINAKVHFVNETLTSFMALDLLEGQGVIGQAADVRVDQLAAQLILQQYLEENASL